MLRATTVVVRSAPVSIFFFPAADRACYYHHTSHPCIRSFLTNQYRPVPSSSALPTLVNASDESRDTTVCRRQRNSVTRHEIKNTTIVTRALKRTTLRKVAKSHFFLSTWHFELSPLPLNDVKS